MEDIFDVAIPEVEKVEKPVNDIIVTANKMVVTNQEQRFEVGSFLKTIKDMEKQVTETFGDMVKTAKSSYDKAKALRDKFLDPLEVAEKDLKAKIVTWEVEQEKIRLQEQVKAIKEAEAKGLEPKIIHPEALKVKGQSLKSIWSAEVTDLMALVKAVAEGKAPISFLLPNQVALNQQAKASMDSIEYPGVKFKETKSLSSTGNSL